ncbi:MAG: hypothetical protein ACWA5R_14315 [bacterium]
MLIAMPVDNIWFILAWMLNEGKENYFESVTPNQTIINQSFLKEALINGGLMKDKIELL